VNVFKQILISQHSHGLQHYFNLPKEQEKKTHGGLHGLWYNIMCQSCHGDGTQAKLGEVESRGNQQKMNQTSLVNQVPC